MDRYNRPLSPGGRRLGQPFRSSTGTLIYPSAYDQYYPPPRSSRESVAGPRTSLERVAAPRVVPRSLKDDPLPVVRRAHDDYVVSPRRSTLDPLSSITRKPVSAVPSGSATSSTTRFQPVISTAPDKPASPFGKNRTRDDEPYYVQPAVSSRRDHLRHNSADSRDMDRLMAANREGRERNERGGYRSTGIAGGRGAYNLNAPLVRQPKDEDDHEYGYEYTDRKEQMYRDTTPRPRRRESLSGRKERPISMAGMEDYLPKLSSSTRDVGPPVTTRGFDKIERSGRNDYQSDTSSSRDYGSGRSKDDSDGGRRRSTRAPVALHQDPEDGYSSYREERSEPHKKHRHRSRRDGSVDRALDDRGLGIRVPREEDSRRDEEDRPRRNHDSERRRDRDNSEDRDPKSRHERHREKHERRGEDLALGAAGAAAATAIVAEGMKQRRDRDREGQEKDSDSLRDRKRDADRDRDRDRSSIIQEPSESSGLSISDEERRERRRQRRREKEALEREREKEALGREREREALERERGKEHDRERERKREKEREREREREMDRQGEDYRGRVEEPDRLKDDPRARSYERESRSNHNQRRNEDEPRRDDHHRRHHSHKEDHESYSDDSSSDSSHNLREPQRKSVVRVVSPAKDKEPEIKPRGILRPPREKFPEDPAPVREGVAPLKEAGKKGVPPNARWTKINRKLVNPEALEMGNERFEERLDYVIVLRVLTKEEIERYTEKTQEIRAMRGEFYDDV